MRLYAIVHDVSAYEEPRTIITRADSLEAAQQQALDEFGFQREDGSIEVWGALRVVPLDAVGEAGTVDIDSTPAFASEEVVTLPIR